MVTFKTLCTISFYHNYFGLNSVEGFFLTPLAGTVKTLTSHGILLKEISGVHYLISKEEEPKSSVNKRLKEDEALRFFLSYKDPYAANYTDLELKSGAGIYLSNVSAHNVGENTYLHSEEYVSKQNVVRFINQPADLMTFFESSSTIQIRNKSSKEEIYSGLCADVFESFSLSELENIGLVEIISNGISSDFFFSAAYSNSFMGLIEIRIDQAALLLKASTFAIRLNSRAVLWRYNLINREQITLSDFKVFSGKNQLEILQEDVVLVNGQNAFAVSTSEPLFLQQRYESLFELEYSKTGAVTSKKRITLPVPDVSKIKVSKTQGGQKSWCDMYIYL